MRIRLASVTIITYFPVCPRKQDNPQRRVWNFQCRRADSHHGTVRSRQEHSHGHPIRLYVSLFFISQRYSEGKHTFTVRTLGTNTNKKCIKHKE